MLRAFHAPLGAIVLMCTGLVAEVAHGAPPPVEAFGQLPALDNIRISPDGKHVAMLQSVQDKNVVTIYTVGAAPGTKPVALNPDKGKVRSLRWANNKRLLIWVSITYGSIHEKYRRTFEFFRIMSVKLDGSGSVYLFQGKAFKNVVGSGQIIGMLPDDPDHVLIAQLDAEKFSRSGVKLGSRIPAKAFRGVSVYKVNVNDGREDKIESGHNNTVDWIVGTNGRVRAQVDEDNGTTVYARPAAGGPFKEVAHYGDGDWRSAMTFWGFGADPNKVYVTARKDSDKLGLYLYDLNSAKISSKIFLHDRLDVDGMVNDGYTYRVLGVRYTDHLPVTKYFDKPLATAQKKLEAAFKGQSISIISTSRDRKLMILFVEAPDNPGTYYLYNVKAHRVSPLGQRYPRLKPENLGRVKPISYAARDGLTIPAYLTLPPGAEAKNLPLVVLPHGGPEVRDDQSFDWWSQFYASRGYAVLQPNYRGSSGYGIKFVRAGYGEFGGKMQDDLTDGVKYLVAQGIADPNRVCIVGGSYGGYAALAGATLTPDLYACAVSVAGISDLVRMLGFEVKQAGQDKNAYNVQYWERWLGRRIGDQDKMKAVSPINHVDKVRAPILLIHGKDDTVVRFWQSERMAKALKKAGKPYKLIELEGEDHWLSQASSRIRILKETEAFLKENIGN